MSENKESPWDNVCYFCGGTNLQEFKYKYRTERYEGIDAAYDFCVDCDFTTIKILRDQFNFKSNRDKLK